MIQNPTKMQIEAINSLKDTVVSAAAGSGKTAVMVERAVKLIREKADIRRMLIITFTNAAAAQLKRRIRKELAQSNETKNDIRLRRQLSYVNTADISTVHAFCIKLCRRYFNIAGIDPLFRIAGDVQRSMLSEEALNELFDERFKSNNNVFREILFAYAHNNETELKNIITGIYEYARSTPDPDAFLKKSEELYSQETSDLYDKWEEAEKQKAYKIVEYLYEASSILKETAGNMAADSAKKVMQKANELSAAACEIKEAFTHGVCPETLETIKSIKIPIMSFPVDTDAETKAEAADYVNKARDIIRKLNSNILFLFGKEACIEKDKAMLPYIEELCSLVSDYAKKYRQKKTEAGVLDFSDVEHYALTILSDNKANREIRAKYDYIFVDEYQDTNDIQEEIIKNIASPANLFCVGDVKQSIYKFRHAEPNIFNARYSEFKQKENASAIDLNTNFRSTPEIISAVNAVFSKIMKKDCGGVDYDQTHMLIPGRTDVSNKKPELHIVLKDAINKEEDMDSITAEAAVCANIIKELLNTKYIDSGTEKYYAYDDIAVLMRSAKDKGDKFIEALQSHGIPAKGNFEEEGVSKGMEQLLCILKAVDNRLDEYAFVSAMRSFAGGFTAAELAEIRLFDPEAPFTKAAYLFADSNISPLAQKLTDFLTKLYYWREQTKLNSVEELIDKIADESGIRAAYASLPDGMAGLEAIQKLIDKAREYDQYSSNGLWGFLQLVDKFSFKGSSDQAMEPNGMVRVMTVHASKGLEFPVVINVFAGTEFNTSDQKGIVYEKTIGVGLPYYDRENCVIYDSAIKRIIADKKAKDSLSEEMRVLYVALTRAREQLHVIGTAAKREEIEKAASDAKSQLEWLLPNAGQSWSVTFHEQLEQPSIAAAEEAPDEENDYSWVQERLNWKYPYPAAPQLPSKIAASAVGREEKIAELKRPSFASYKTAPTSTEIGTFVHKALLHVDLSTAVENNSIKTQIDHLVQKGLIRQEEAEYIDTEMIRRFATSPLAKRIISSNKVLKEAPFNMLVPASTLGFISDEELMVQGIIDCAFIEDEKWVIVDYKTDNMPQGGIEEIINRYRNQLEIYSQALESSTGIQVKNSYIYLLKENIEITIKGG